jgi:hypothetical protein
MSEKLLESAKKIQTWIHAHPHKATIVTSVIEEFDKAIEMAEVPLPDAEITEEEYKNFALDYATNNGRGEYGLVYKACNDTIKWLRSRFRGDFREELIKFAKFLTDKDCPYAIINGDDMPFAATDEDFTIEEVIDEYLNQLINKQ